ncbi:MAG: hypothetical protein GX927_14435 [Lentisphaerae bacterium]|jgi:hypothetical protein|nr:hypothetical protein [Lentisphaerota bacterium]
MLESSFGVAFTRHAYSAAGTYCTLLGGSIGDRSTVSGGLGGSIIGRSVPGGRGSPQGVP